MSTFNGIVKEFPDIRIDFFRTAIRESRPPLAYFLSHVHSDHLQGLETCKSPFVYCSPATKEILLRLEKYPHRMNFAKGILESRKQTYKHLRKLLKAIPLDTPIDIELAPGRTIRVTLLDANHCIGAVMFLIEDKHHAILYTGDIRSELWWVDALTRSPTLIPYVHHQNRKPIRQLDCMYLDTTFASKADPYKHFPQKAEGVDELLRKVSRYSEDTVFYFDSWTFGYEDVWLALSNFLRCQIHVDQYRYKLYATLEHAPEPRAVEAPRITGFTCGNHRQEGCLTTEQSARIHSCEQGTRCTIFSSSEFSAN
jgi:DNA cross-link repair 1C protein